MIYAGWLLCYSEPPRNIPVVRELSLAAFLVYIAAVLFYKPIFTQPLRFILCATGAVEKPATERAVGVVYLRDSIPEQMKYDFLAEAASHLMQVLNDPEHITG